MTFHDPESKRPFSAAELADEAKEEVGMRIKVWGPHGMTPKRVTKLQMMRAIEHYFRVTAQAEPVAKQGDLFEPELPQSWIAF